MFQYQVAIEDGMIDTSAIDFRATPCHCSVHKMTCESNLNCTNEFAELYDFNWTRKSLGYFLYYICYF